MKHIVTAGECITSIACDYGFFADTLWNHPDNAELKQLRKNPNVLLAGDVVFIPDKRVKTQSCGTNKRHRFLRKGVPAKLTLRVSVAGKPRANEPFVAEIDDKRIEGVTTAEGVVEFHLWPGAARGTLTVGAGRTATRFDLLLRQLDPIETIAGAQQRLMNLGFGAGALDGKLGPSTVAAIKAFQEENGLAVTGELDDQTRQKLVSRHGV